jgi:hypothetical protein
VARGKVTPPPPPPPPALPPAHYAPVPVALVEKATYHFIAVDIMTGAQSFLEKD